jgi:hypothetical protein
MKGRIYFKGNPWLNGHKIEDFNWRAKLIPEEGIYFHLHLETVSYSAEDMEDVSKDEDEENSQGDWYSKGVWTNYHSCTLSSTNWDDSKGILVASGDKKLTFFDNVANTLLVDTLPIKRSEEYTFGIYLLGHDSVADHQIIFTKISHNNYDINWQGKIALSYIGSDEFKYDFEARIEGAAFDGIEIPDGLNDEQAWRYLRRYVQNPESLFIKQGNSFTLINNSIKEGKEIQ